MSFAQILGSMQTAMGDFFPVVVGLAVALVVIVPLTITVVRNRRRGLDFAALKAMPANPVLEERAAEWAPPEQSYADRRGSVRREGVPVRVHLAATSLRNGVTDGYVVDRSTGGLRIVSTSAMAPGSTVQVRAVNAPDTIGFVSVIVRSCRKNPDHFELGCEFEKTPPWNVLLLFG